MIECSEIEKIYGERFIKSKEIRVFYEGNDAFRDIFKEIGSAKRSVLLVFYIFKNDETGRLLATILKKKASEGVRVCVLHDHFGSLLTPPGFWKDLRKKGVEVRASRPFKWKALGDYIHRDHRKLIVIDGMVAFTGGLNIGDEYRGRGLIRSKKGGWRDTAIKIRGPVARRLHEIFSKTWLFWNGDPIDGVVKGYKQSSDGGQKVIPIFSSSSRGRKRIRKLLYWCIGNAKDSICLTTAYFTPSRRMMFVFREAVQRGVSVRLLLPGFSDLKSVMYAGRASFSQLLKWGVDIYLYQESVLHAKSYMFDSVFSIVGSANLDFQSLRKNDEGNIGVYDEGFAADMESIFNRDLARSKKIHYEEWIKRPLVIKVIEKFFVLFRRRL